MQIRCFPNKPVATESTVLNRRMKWLSWFSEQRTTTREAASSIQNTSNTRSLKITKQKGPPLWCQPSRIKTTISKPRLTSQPCVVFKILWYVKEDYTLFANKRQQSSRRYCFPSSLQQIRLAWRVSGHLTTNSSKSKERSLQKIFTLLQK